VAGTTEIEEIIEKNDKGEEIKRQIKTVYNKIVGYEDIIEMVASYLDR